MASHQILITSDAPPAWTGKKNLCSPTHEKIITPLNQKGNQSDCNNYWRISILMINRGILPSLQTKSLQNHSVAPGQRCSQSTWLSPGQLQTTPIDMPGTEETSESGLCLPQQGRQQGRHHQEWIVHCPLKTPEQDHLLPKIPDIRCLQHCLQHSELHRVVSYDQHCMSSLVFLS